MLFSAWLRVDVGGSVRSSAVSVLLAQYSGGLIRTPYCISEAIRIDRGGDIIILYGNILRY